MSGQPVYHLEMIAMFLFAAAVDVSNTSAMLLHDGHLLVMPVADLDPGDAAIAVANNFFAEVTIPFHTNGQVYGYTFHVFNKYNHEPAINETAALQTVIEHIHARYADRCAVLEVPRG